MLRPISSFIHIAAAKIDTSKKDIDAILKDMKSTYNTTVKEGTKPEHIVALYEALKKLPAQLVRDCKIDEMGFEDLGPSKEFYPNHGKYIQGTLVINERIFDDSKVDEDKNGNKLTKFSQTLYHEYGHGVDEKKSSNESDWLSMQDDWMSLSGWSKEPIPGHKRLIIREEGCPILKGEMYYSPDAKFTRFYARRNSYDDLADHFSYFVGGLKSLVPKEKREYFEKKLSKYYE
jgi:hypothetical protein